MKILPLTLLALLAAAPSAQVDYLGSSCSGGSNEKPVLTVEGMIVDGEPFEVVVDGVPLAPGLLLAGVDLLAPGLDLAGAGVPGCTLLVSPLVLAPFATDVDGEFSSSVEAWAAGVPVYVQAFVVDEDDETLGAVTRTARVEPLGPGGEIVITEIMKDPDFVPDGRGEWVELHNRTDADVDVEGWLLRDDGVESVVLDNAGAGLVVPAGGYVTLGNEADPALNGGLQHLWVYDGFVLENGEDEVVLQRDPDDETSVVDRVAYLDGLGWPDEIGRALALDAGFAHTEYNDDEERWAAATCSLGGTPFNPDAGTPGASADTCDVVDPPAPTGALIFTEVMQNPKAVFDEVGEWLELLNTTGAPLDLAGWTLVAGGVETIAGPLVVPAGGYALLAASGDSGQNGGLPAPDWVWGNELFLGNSSELLQLYDADGALVCELDYDDGATFPDPNGASMQLAAGLLTIDDSLDGSLWCEASSAWAGGDLGTPRAPNESCP